MTEPNFSFSRSLAEINQQERLNENKGWKSYTTSVKVAIVLTVILVVVGIILAITLPLVLKKKKNPHGGNVAHKYKCVRVKGNYECVVDDTNGTSKIDKCCGFRCGLKGCVFDENGAYDSPLSCFEKCNQASTFYGCINNQCEPTTNASPLFPNDPCCGLSPCARVCNGVVPPPIIELQETHFQTLTPPSGTLNFGLQIGAVKTASSGVFRVFSSYYEESKAKVLNAFIQVNEVTFVSSTQLNDSSAAQISLSCRYNPASPNVAAGQNGQGLLTSNMVRAGACTEAVNLFINNDFQNAWTFEQNASLLTMSKTLPWGFALDGGSLNANTRTDGITTSLSTGYPADITQLCTATNSAGTVVTIFGGIPAKNTLTKIQFNVNGTASSWGNIQSVPVENLPSAITALGSPLACSQDQAVILTGSNNELVLLNLDTSTGKYKEEGLITVDGLNNTAVSTDGMILAWTSNKLSNVYVALKKTEPGFHNTLLLSVPSTTSNPTTLGVGGLSVVKVDATHYVVCSASGTSTPNKSSEVVYLWIVQVNDS